MKNLFLAAATLFFCSQSEAQETDSSAFYFNKGLQEKTSQRLLAANQAFDKAGVDADQMPVWPASFSRALPTDSFAFEFKWAHYFY